MTEVAKRLTPLGPALRELFLKSGNLCAFPGCHELMMDADGLFVGQVCHIEAAEPGGERFNASMTNEERRAVSNLLLMCYPHHIKTNDLNAFPVRKLRDMKADHERRFSHPDRAMLLQLQDWTDTDIPKEPTSLRRFNVVVGWRLTDVELEEPLAELTAHITKFRTVPIETRRFLGAVVARAHKMRDQPVVNRRGFGVKIALDDILSALRLSDEAAGRSVTALSNYGLGDFHEVENEGFGPQYAIRIRDIGESWGWMEIAAYCESEAIDLAALIDDLDFSRLD